MAPQSIKQVSREIILNSNLQVKCRIKPCHTKLCEHIWQQNEWKLRARFSTSSNTLYSVTLFFSFSRQNRLSGFFVGKTCNNWNHWNTRFNIKSFYFFHSFVCKNLSLSCFSILSYYWMALTWRGIWVYLVFIIQSLVIFHDWENLRGFCF